MLCSCRLQNQYYNDNYIYFKLIKCTECLIIALCCLDTHSHAKATYEYYNDYDYNLDFIDSDNIIIIDNVECVENIYYIYI